jgi:hypothetical protein
MHTGIQLCNKLNRQQLVVIDLEFNFTLGFLCRWPLTTLMDPSSTDSPPTPTCANQHVSYLFFNLPTP